MIKLNDIKLEKSGKVLYVLPGMRTTECAYHALDVLMEIRDLTARTIEPRKERKPVMKTKSGAVITRRHSGNKRHFLGV